MATLLILTPVLAYPYTTLSQDRTSWGMGLILGIIGDKWG